jgi:hypothetical protein
MKTQIITLLTALALVAGAAKAETTATAKNENVTVLTDVSHINKIELRGNVLLYISDGSADQVKVYNKYYAESAMVKSRNGVLSIASYKAEKLVVWVTAADLDAIAAYDNSEVKTFGEVSKIEFNVELHNNASAKLSFDAFTANVTLADNAKADLSGAANEVYLTRSVGSSVNRSNLSAENFTEIRTGLPIPANSDDITAL